MSIITASERHASPQFTSYVSVYEFGARSVLHSALSVKRARGSFSSLLLSASYPFPSLNRDDNAFQIPII